MGDGIIQEIIRGLQLKSHCWEVCWYLNAKMRVFFRRS